MPSTREAHSRRKRREAVNVKQIALVGKRIRTLRKERELTQAELSARIGIQQSDLCRMESGEYKVSLETLFKILKIFEMNVAEFFHVTTAGELTPDEEDLVASYRSLPRTSRDQVREFIQFTDQRARPRRTRKPVRDR
jgi:transcriptional regulator with XRE-family HTH domain